LDESAVGRWVDEIYAGKVAEQWKIDYGHAAAEFEATCIRPLRPFQADEQLEDLFYKAFDGLEVLPWALHDEYQALKEDNPILAGELLVPISWGRYHALASEGRVLPRDRHEPYVVRARYDSEMGLSFAEEPEEDDLWD
jgi:hypothetical protein